MSGSRRLGATLARCITIQALLLAAAPAARGQATGAVLRDLEAQRFRQGAVPWTPGRRLDWSDFAAPAPPDDSGAAHVTTGLLYATECLGAEFRFAVQAAFVPARSWVAARVLGDAVRNERILAHEQTHFDLSEVEARELRRALAGYPDPCGELKGGMAALIGRFSALERDLQSRYDTETAHGALRDRQREWEALARARLDSLAAFAAPAGSRRP